MKFELKDTTVSFLEFTSMADWLWLPTLVQKAKDMVYREVMAQIEATADDKQGDLFLKK